MLRPIRQGHLSDMKPIQNRVFVQVLFSICLVSLPGKTTGTGEAADNNSTHFSRFSLADSAVNSTSSISRGNTSVPQFPSVLYCYKKPQFKPGRGTILTYLLRLKLCQIITGQPWLDEECSRRRFGFTSYYELAYTKVCDPSLYQGICQIENSTYPATIVRKVLKLNNLHDDYKEYSNEKTSEKTKTDFPLHQEQLACFHIETYFQTLSRELADPVYRYANLSQNKYPPFYNVGYTEWFLTFREFCNSASCGVSEDNYESHSISAYDCFSKSCKTVVIYEMVFDSALAFIIVVANGLVLLVSRRTTAMKNIPGYFKMSLAVADLIIGAFVIPGVVYNHYVQTFLPLPYRQENQHPAATDYFNLHYINFLGVTTNLSLFVSISTLCAASIDRYLAIAKPFEYENRRFFTNKKCFVTIIAIWLFGLLYATLPIVVSVLSVPRFPPYTLAGNDLIFWTGSVPTITYGTMLGLSLLAVWVINIATLFSVKSQKKRSKTSHSKKILKSKRSLKKEQKNDISETTTRLTNQHEENRTKGFLSVDDIDNTEKLNR